MCQKETLIPQRGDTLFPLLHTIDPTPPHAPLCRPRLLNLTRKGIRIMFFPRIRFSISLKSLFLTSKWLHSTCFSTKSSANFFSIYLRLYSPCGLSRFFSFLIYKQSVGLLGRGISPPQGRYLHIEQHKHYKRTQTSMLRVGFELMTPIFERAMTVHALDDASTAIGRISFSASSKSH
jgi:hypothetical protein